MIRSDLKIPGLNLVLETKCTGEKTRLKKLTEEIEADIVHYSEDYILFYIYDKGKIIKDKQNYENQFRKKSFRLRSLLDFLRTFIKLMILMIIMVVINRKNFLSIKVYNTYCTNKW